MSTGGSTGRARWRLAFLAISVPLVAGPALMPFHDTLDPSMTASGSEEPARVCVAVLDGWHPNRPGPSEADVSDVDAHLGNADLLDPDQLKDPAARARLLDEEHQFESTSEYKAFTSYADWRYGPGQCVPGGRHRLILAAFALAGTIIIAAARALWSRRPSGAPLTHVV